MLHLAKINFVYETFSFAKIFHRGTEGLSTGSLLVTKRFGCIVDIYNVDEAIWDQILAKEGLSSERLTKIAEALTKERSEGFSEKVSRKSLHVIYKCGTTSFPKKLIFSFDEKKWS